MHPLINQQHIDAFQSDGVVLIKGMLKDYVSSLRDGVEANMANPSPFGQQSNLHKGQAGTFFDDYCNWQRIPQFEDVARHSPAAQIASDLMQSSSAQLFHDHVLVKEPGTAAATPWHQDSPYYFVEGEQTVSFWVPLDVVDSATLRCVPGSHMWEKPVVPMRWLSQTDFYAGEDVYMPVPDPDAQNMPVVEWAMEPGDAVAFNFKILHGTRGEKLHARRRAFALRFVGDDARYVERAGSTSPPFAGHGMSVGDKLREDWFPIVYSK